MSCLWVNLLNPYLKKNIYLDFQKKKWIHTFLFLHQGEITKIRGHMKKNAF